MRIITNKILMTIGLVTIFLAMFYMGSSEEKRSLRHLAIDDTVSLEEYISIIKEHFREFSLCRCIDYGIVGYEIKLEDGYLGTFYSIENPEQYKIELAILDSCAKEAADSIPIGVIFEETKEGHRDIMLTCLDFYNSEKLDSLITTLVEEKKEIYDKVQKEHYKSAKEDLKYREQWEKEQKELKDKELDKINEEK